MRYATFLLASQYHNELNQPIVGHLEAMFDFVAGLISCAAVVNMIDFGGD